MRLRRKHRSKDRRPGRGVTLVELLITVCILAILAGLAIVRSDVGTMQAEAAARNFAADAAFVQAEAIARPDVGCLFRVAADRSSYWVARKAAPDTPITHPIRRQPYRVYVGKLNADGLDRVTINGFAFGGDNDLQFDAFGAPDQSTAATIDFVSAKVGWRVRIDPLTGVATVSRITDTELSIIEMEPPEEED